MLPSESDSDIDRGKIKNSKKENSNSDDSDVEEKSKKGPKTSLISAIFKQKKSRENSNPPDEKDDKKKAKKKKRERKESPKKKKKRDRSESSSSSDEISVPPSSRRSPATSPSPPPKRANTVKVRDRPDSSTSGEIVDPPPRFSSPSPSPSRSRSQDLNHHSVSSPSPELSRPTKSGRGLHSPPAKKRSLSRSPVYHSRSSMSRSPSPAAKPEQKPISSTVLATPLSPMLSPLSGGESGAERGRKGGRSRKERDASIKLQNAKTEVKKDSLDIKEEPVEFAETKSLASKLRPTPSPSRSQEATAATRHRLPSYEDKASPSLTGQAYSKARKESSRSLSEEDDTPGSVEPYCQEYHMPHPSIEELTDPKYLSRLQAINMVMMNPHTAVSLLNSVVDLILETGNFSTEQENFQFDICNLDQGTIAKIEAVLELP